MSEAQGVVRTNISVPRELKARMDAVQLSVNWSAVASQAFEAKLLELASQKEVKGMDDVIARLKAADELDHKEEYLAGRKAGEVWAKEKARPKQLRPLEEIAENPLLDGMGDYAKWVKPVSIAWGLYRDLHPEKRLPMNEPAWSFTKENEELNQVEAFWDQVLGDNGKALINQKDFAQGFFDGALGVWQQVKAKL